MNQFKQTVVPSGSSSPERQQSTGQSGEINSRSELEAGPTSIEQALKEIAGTDGIECNDSGNSVYNELQTRGLVSFGPKRGPGGSWFRVELTEKGNQFLSTILEQPSKAQIAPSSAAQKAALVKAGAAAERQKQELDKLSGLTSLDWKNIPPPMLAQLLVNIPFKGASGEPDFYLAPWQAMIFALRAFELGLSPFSNEVWFNPKNNKTNVSFEGKLKLARMAGLNLSPPLFERIPKDEKSALVAYKCTITTPSGPCEYTATLKEWRMPSSPVWRDKPEHMLQLRAAEKCLSFATGSGSSELMGEQDLQTGKEVESFIPSFTQEK